MEKIFCKQLYSVYPPLPIYVASVLNKYTPGYQTWRCFFSSALDMTDTNKQTKYMDSIVSPDVTDLALLVVSVYLCPIISQVIVDAYCSTRVSYTSRSTTYSS